MVDGDLKRPKSADFGATLQEKKKTPISQTDVLTFVKGIQLTHNQNLKIKYEMSWFLTVGYTK